ncbi:hypothetical protein ACFLVA_00495 [Chloroflexota bacterium]
MLKQDRKIIKRYREQSNRVGVETKYFIEDLGKLHICSKCCCLYGEVRLNDGKVRQQRCSCDILDEENWFDGAYHDFNDKYEICYSCGLEVIPSGSRWSLFYCIYCKERIVKINNAIGRVVIPHGRHSLMNRITVDNNNLFNDAKVKEFVNSVNELSGSIDLLDEHRKAVIKKQMKLLDIKKKDPLIELYNKTLDTKLGSSKDQSIKEVLILLSGESEDTVRAFFEKLKI